MPVDAASDLFVDCLKGEHELQGRVYPSDGELFMGIRPPAIVDFDGTDKKRRTFTARPMTPEALCPESHFRCAEKGGNCLPVYLR